MVRNYKRKKERVSDEKIREIMSQIRNQNISLRQAGRLHKIPESTLREMIKRMKNEDERAGREGNIDDERVKQDPPKKKSGGQVIY